MTATICYPFLNHADNSFSTAFTESFLSKIKESDEVDYQKVIAIFNETKKELKSKYTNPLYWAFLDIYLG